MLNFVITIILFGIFIQLPSSCETKPAVSKTIQGKSKMEEQKNEEKKVLLETEIQLQDKTLKISYKIKNQSEKPVYLFNVLWDFSSSGEYISAPQPAYSCLRDDGIFVVAKQIPPLPKSKRVELKIIPFVTKVEAGSEFSDNFELPVPASEYNPYFPRKNNESEKIKTAEAVIFKIDYVAETDGLEVKPAPLENALTVWHQDLNSKTETLSSNLKTVGLQVKRRTDTFERF